MKKDKTIISKLTLIMLFTLCLFSCTESNSFDADCDKKINESDIFNILKNYNDSIASAKQSRGIGWIGWLSVAIADCKGAYSGAKYGGRIGALLGPNGAAIGATAGGIIVGGASSYSQFQVAKTISEFSPYSLQPQKIESQATFVKGFVLSENLIKEEDFSLGISNGLDSCSVRIAIQHNIILDKIDEFSVADARDVCENLSDMERDIIYSEDFSNLYNSTVEDPLNLTIEQDNNADQVIELFIEAVETSCTDQESLNDIVKHYRNVVTFSLTLTDEEKENIYTSISVMTYSFKYWSEKYPYLGN